MYPSPRSVFVRAIAWAPRPSGANSSSIWISASAAFPARRTSTTSPIGTPAICTSDPATRFDDAARGTVTR